MSKRFKLKFSRVIPSFQFCRSKKPSHLPETPGPVTHRLSPVNPKALDIFYPNLPAPPPSTPDYSFFKCHLSPKIATVGCGCRARSSHTQYLPSVDVSFESPDYSSKKVTTRLHAVVNAHNHKLQRKTCKASVSDESKNEVDKKDKKMEKERATASVSSRDSGCFSSEGTENEETKTLISASLSFSDDSFLELDESLAGESHNETKKSEKKINNGKKVKRLRSFGSKKYRGPSKPNCSKTKTKTKTGALSSESTETDPARRMMVPHRTAEEKVRESVAVVQKSEDPYEDFKRSMLEMILEKQMFEANDLEQLLQCFLSLNSRQYHGIIVEAFTEIWETLFGGHPKNLL
ncbi:hypothetical protein ERO13_D05G198300v2 [Gossypium hirsutum]|uniref:Transcription repressor n=5 Tax=Gossypium TaxID=3633 RepID=A0A1U8J1Q3_GOSHI|nr:transcription repressor OFP7-like [Gossypium hirsutum]KAB2030051.1 hypothetical protein ES319_D05G204700v1 [Gossypium barbadense]TYG69232.1 hypothetical protein ES288_D05G215300v1 [Gossypium darwinii]TYH71864.1 hypothetical protein ES332_D05G214400v1 [Gossypium tomentosum]TYI82258.1 hypothetical protein E1A91_D05G210000v1 [Gossypium mustelinum]KAG4147038.1 hypothetical protein ERO13_D05G198300v2 [Gossypium hirsutum]